MGAPNLGRAVVALLGEALGRIALHAVLHLAQVDNVVVPVHRVLDVVGAQCGIGVVGVWGIAARQALAVLVGLVPAADLKAGRELVPVREQGWAAVVGWDLVPLLLKPVPRLLGDAEHLVARVVGGDGHGVGDDRHLAGLKDPLVLVVCSRLAAAGCGFPA